MTCNKAQEFLAKNNIDAIETVDARKMPMTLDDAIELARQAEDIYASKGKKVMHMSNRQESLDRERLASLLIGPTGNLRAPALVAGKTLIVGFDEDTYKRVLLQ